MLGRADGFMLTVKLGDDFFSTSELLYLKIKDRLCLIRARADFYMISDNRNFSLGLLTLHSLYCPQGWLSQQRNGHACLNVPVEFNFSEPLSKTSIIPARQNQFIQENVFNNAPVHRIAFAMNINSAFTGLKTENLFWFQEFNLRQSGILRGGQPILSFDAADNCRLYVTTMKAMNFQGQNPPILIDNFKYHYVLVLDFMEMQNATENYQNPEPVGKPLRLDIIFTFPQEHVNELLVLWERKSLVAVVVWRNI